MAKVVHISVAESPGEPRRGLIAPESPHEAAPTDSPTYRPSRITRIPMWEAKWSAAALRAYWQTLTDNAIARGYRQVPVSDDALLFRNVGAALDDNLIVQQTIDPKSIYFKWRRYAGNDIATGDSATSAWWVLITIAIHPKTRHRYILNLRRYKGLSLGKQFDLMKEVYEQMLWEVCGVENNGIQSGIVKHYQEEELFPVKPIHTGAEQKTDFEIGIPAMASEWENGMWHIPNGDATSKRIMAPLVEEFKAYPTGRTTDTVMGCFFAREMALQAPRGKMSASWLSF